MARQPNAVDFWRGFALITIFIDHIPGLVYAKYTLVNFSISDAADLFVFLAGWSLRLMADGGGRTGIRKGDFIEVAAQFLSTVTHVGRCPAVVD